MTRDQWVWMPHPAHFICANDCKFHLATWVGGFIVSTVGEYVPDAPVREVLAQSRDVALEGRGDERLADYMEKVGFEDIGYKRKYETMVFLADHSEDGSCGCPYRPTDLSELEMQGYNAASEAVAGHMALCERYAAMEEVIHD